MWFYRYFAGLLPVLLLSMSVQAAPVTTLPIPGGYLDVDAIYGTGSKTAYYIMDFGGNGGGKVAYGVRFDAANLTGIDGMNILDTLGPINVSYNNFGSLQVPNLFVESLGNGLYFDSPDYFDPLDPGRFWSLWQGTATGTTINWGFANLGLSGVDKVAGVDTVVDFLADGEIYGFYAGDGSVQPSFPLAAIPEPGTWAVLVSCGSVAIVFARRRRVS